MIYPGIMSVVILVIILKCCRMSSGTPIRNEQQVNDLLTAILLPSEIAAIKIEAHTKRTEPHYQGNAIADFHAKATATESKKVLARVDEVHSPSTKK